MLFERQYRLFDIKLPEGETIELSEEAPHPIRLLIRRPLSGEDDQKVAATDYVGIVSTEESITEKVRKQFDSTGDRPPAVDEIRKRVSDRLEEYISRAARVLRWLGDFDCKNPMHRPMPLRWSDDGEAWHVLRDPLPAPTNLDYSIRRTLSRTLFVDLMKSGKGEPLAHELLREAWSLRTASPRSSLLVGMAAAEVGFKTFISAVVPHAEWLAFNAPTPSLYNMLTNYFPELPLTPIFGVSPFIPEKLRTELKVGTTLRNDVAHAGGAAPPPNKLRDILQAVSDLLYLLDAYLGYGWARYHISRKTYEDIQADVKQKKLIQK